MVHDVMSAAMVVLTIGSAYRTLARLAAMDGATTPVHARRQHAGLFAGLVMSLALPGVAGQAALAAGVLLYLTHSQARWRFVPPWEANRPPREWSEPPPSEWRAPID